MNISISRYRLTTTDIALAGFTNAALLDASRWRGSNEQSAAEVAAAELAYTFGFPAHMKFPAVDDMHQDALVSALRQSFTNRGGDLLIIFQNTVVLDDTTTTRVDPTSGMEEGLNVIARCVDAINRAYASAEQAGDANLAGVSVVLEGFGRSGLPNLQGAWSHAQRVSFDVQPFTDALPT